MKQLRSSKKLIGVLALSILLITTYNNCSNSSFKVMSGLGHQNSSFSGSSSPSPSLPPPVLPPVVPVDLAAHKASPASFELEDWTSGSANVVGKVSFNTRMPNLSFEDTLLQAEMGEVLVLNSDQSITWKGFEFGGIAFISATLGEGDTPLYQVLIGAKPSGRWSTYPFSDTFNASTDVTIPPAFKIVLRDYNNQVITRMQMRDGKPINDPSLSQARTSTEALRPFFNCGMLLPWTNTRPRLNPNLKRYFPGFKTPPDSRAKAVYSANAAIPLLARGAEGRVQVNGLNNWFYLPQWPMNSSTTTATDPNQDPYIGDPDRFYTGDGAYKNAFRSTGWDYEPGSISGHDWLTGPGGIRFDRAVIPTPMAYLISNPSYKRLKDQRPIADLAHAWGLAYFNHSNNYLTDVKNFSTIMKNESTILEHSFLNAYYGRAQFVSAQKGIDIRAIANGDYRLEGSNGGTPDSFFNDKNGNRFWGGYAVDDHHAHQTPYYQLLMASSPMHIVASRSAFNGSILSHLNTHHTTIRGDWNSSFSYASFNTRVQAWRWLHYTLAWKMGSQHPLGIPRSLVMNVFKDDLHHYYDNVLIPILNEATNPYHVSIKNLGMPVEPYQENGKWVLRVGSAIAFYHGPVFLLMKRLGLWDELRKDTKSKAVLDFVFNSLSKYSIDFILDTNGRAEDESGVVAVTDPVTTFNSITANQIPSSWAQWAQRYPAQGNENWIKRADGTHLERYAAQHIRAQWAIMVRDWFPEMNYPRAAQAAAMYENFYKEIDTYVATKANPTEKQAADFSSLIISYSPIASP